MELVGWIFDMSMIKLFMLMQQMDEQSGYGLFFELYMIVQL